MTTQYQVQYTQRDDSDYTDAVIDRTSGFTLKGIHSTPHERNQ